MIEGAVSVSTIIDRSQNVHITNFNRSKHPKYHYLNNSPYGSGKFLAQDQKNSAAVKALAWESAAKSVHKKSLVSFPKIEAR